MIYTFEKTPVNVDRLILEINNSAIVTDLTTVTFFDGDLDIEFDDALSSGDETILDDLVDAHAGNPIPVEVTPRQIRQALILSGITMQQIEDALNTLSEPTKSLALSEWEYSNMFDRTRPLVASVGAMLGWTSQQLDDLWIYAGTL